MKIDVHSAKERNHSRGEMTAVAPAASENGHMGNLLKIIYESISVVGRL